MNPDTTALQPWTLYKAWCAAQGHGDAHTFDPARMEAFWEDVPAAPTTRAARERIILRQLEAHGAIVPHPEHTHRSAWRTGPAWADLETALEAIPTVGWPEGMRGRRDAFLLTMLHQGLTRREAQNITVNEIQWPAPGDVLIRGVKVPTATSPQRCAACAVCRWLRAICLADYRDLPTLRSTMNAQRARTVGHVCQEPNDDQWQATFWSMLPSVNRWGHVEHYEHRLSLAAISAITAYRQFRGHLNPFHPAQSTHTFTDLNPDIPLITQAVDIVAVRDEVDDLFNRVDEQLDAADEILARIDAEADAYAAHMDDLRGG